jgi:hypothetical protein
VSRDSTCDNSISLQEHTLNTSTDAFDHALVEAQAFHKQFEEAATKNEAPKPAHSRKANADAQHRSEIAKAKS